MAIVAFTHVFLKLMRRFAAEWSAFSGEESQFQYTEKSLSLFDGDFGINSGYFFDELYIWCEYIKNR